MNGGHRCMDGTWTDGTERKNPALVLTNPLVFQRLRRGESLHPASESPIRARFIHSNRGFNA